MYESTNNINKILCLNTGFVYVLSIDITLTKSYTHHHRRTIVYLLQRRVHSCVFEIIKHHVLYYKIVLIYSIKTRLIYLPLNIAPQGFC